MKLRNGVPTKKQLQYCIDQIHRGYSKFYISNTSNLLILITRCATKDDCEAMCELLTTENTTASVTRQWEQMCYGNIEIKIKQ